MTYGVAESALTVLEIAVATLSTQDQDAAHRRVREHCSRAEVPDQRVAEEVDLAVVLHPEVLNASKTSAMSERRWRERTMPRRRRGQASGRESYVWRSVKPALVVHMTFWSSQNLAKNPGSL